MSVFQILPKSILSIDHGRGLVMKDKAYKSISHYAGSSVLCKLNKVQYENITKMSELKSQLVSLFHDCYRQFVWSKIKHAIDIQFTHASFRDWLLQTGTKPINYITFNRDTEFGVSVVRGKVQGRNRIGRYLEDLRRTELEKNGPPPVSQKLKDRIVLCHFTHSLLVEYVRETGNKVSYNNFADGFLYSLKKRLQLTREDNLYLQSHDTPDSAHYLLTRAIKELHEGKYAKEYWNNVYELYVNNQLTEEEMLDINNDALPKEYHELLNQRAFDNPLEEPDSDLEAEKEIVLNEYLKNFYQRNNVSQEERAGFQQTTSLEEFKELADRVWGLFQRKLVHPDVYIAAQNILHSKEFSLFGSPEKKERPPRRKASPAKLPNPLDLLNEQQIRSPKKKQKEKIEGIVIRENVDPKKSDPKSLNAFPDGVVMGNLAYPTWMAWVYSQSAQYLLPDPDKNDAEVRKSFTVNPAPDNDPNPSNFMTIGAIANLAWKNAQHTMNELLFKYIREGLVERMHRDAEFRQDLLLTGSDTLQYWNPVNLYLGVNLGGQGENRVGKFLETIRSQVSRDQPINPTESFPVQFVFSEGEIKFLVQDKLSAFLHRLYTFEQFLQEPRPGYVPRSGGVGSDDVTYLQNQLGTGCGQVPKMSDIPEGFSQLIRGVLAELPAFQTPTNLHGLLWRGIEPFLFMVWKYLFTTKVTNEAIATNETGKFTRLMILNDMSEWVTYAYPRTRTNVEMALNRAKEILLDYVPNVTDKEQSIVDRHAPLLLIGKESALFYAEHPRPDDLPTAITEFCNKYTDRWLWIHSFNGFYRNESA